MTLRGTRAAKWGMYSIELLRHSKLPSKYKILLFIWSEIIVGEEGMSRYSMIFLAF
jgi:hypothetical protein